MLNPSDLLLYLCTDRALLNGRSLACAVEEAIDGGVTMVQLREKSATSREFYELALEIGKITRRRGVPLVIDDRLDIALASGADGLHIGQSDIPLAAARALLGGERFIGVSAGTPAEAVAAERGGADYLGVGAVYPTTSKDGVGDAIGLLGLGAVMDSVSIPVVAIGGVGERNADAVMGAGVAGIAVISAILAKEDVGAAARALKGIVSRRREPRR
ncbi:MAG: thiamine phosphate synthase [Clostridiales bacterium]|jgi:thiamine-phosphate pyrophosphorylase|nr:thiamine phosphate synthase [Clostridiales bacterium]